MKKKVTYKEPASYFNKEMKKAAKDWEKNNAKTTKTSKSGKK